MGLFSGGGLLGGLTDIIFGEGGKDSFNQNVDLQNKFANQIQGLSEEQKGKLEPLIQSLLDNANKFQVNNDEAIKQSNANMEKSRDIMNANLYNSGFTPQSNNVVANNNAELSKQKGLMEADLRNQANLTNQQSQQNALLNASGLYSQMYGNQFNALGMANQARTNGLNALGAYANGNRNQNMAFLGSILGLGGSLLGGKK